MGDVKIYSFYYKPIAIDKVEESYVPVWAGKNGAPGVEGFTGDDTGDNISAKNKFYSELSGIYWVWKNTKSDIVGTCHYRRYYTTAKEPSSAKLKRLLYYPAKQWKKRFGLIYTANFDYWKPKIISGNQTIELLEIYDVILPVRRILRHTIRKHYQKYHNPNDLVLIENILKEYYPEYLVSFDRVLDNNRLFANNMFIAKWETFEKLMDWLFFILFEFEKRCNLNDYTGYQERIFGFLSERLITLWAIHNQLKYKELPLIYFKKLKKK